jgi:pyruvate-ferredoxin/flavodoxin oxidoreductase
MEVPMTFADFAITEARFRKHFRKAPRNTWNDNMIPLSEFLEMAEDDREGKFPFIWAVDRSNQLSRVLVAREIVQSCEERRDFWIMLRDLSGVQLEAAEEVDVESKIRAEVISKMTQKLIQLVAGKDSSGLDLTVKSTRTEAPKVEPVNSNGTDMAPWLETEDCTACDECINLNPKIFQYNKDKKAYIKDPKGGPYKDLVVAAEKCTAQVIHPGLPSDTSLKDIEKWIKRGEKFN